MSLLSRFLRSVSGVAGSLADGAEHAASAYDARVHTVQINSRALGLTKEFYVYTPPGYSTSRRRRYPVLYLFRGAASEWINKEQDPTRAGRNVVDVFEELLVAGSVGPMILVFPGTSSDDNSVPGMVTNFKSPHLTSKPGIGTGQFEDFFVREMIPYVDARYRTIASRGGRGVAGFSLGGFMSAKLAAKFPEMFSTVGAFDGTHFYAADDRANVDAARDAITFHNPMFDPAFDRPRDTAFAALNNGPNLVCNASPRAMQAVAWFVQYGPREAEPDDSNFYRGEHLLEKLGEKGVRNGVAPVLRGGHNWKTADEHMRQTFPLHWQVLRRVVKS
jgi:enterochelin esterase-like enzyme